jgi:hypothetical protein
MLYVFTCIANPAECGSIRHFSRAAPVKVRIECNSWEMQSRLLLIYILYTCFVMNASARIRRGGFCGKVYYVYVHGLLRSRLITDICTFCRKGMAHSAIYNNVSVKVVVKWVKFTTPARRPPLF